jgi:ABC-type bacteriocin/lantibiotic exporter with double-glycine peptidase domain
VLDNEFSASSASYKQPRGPLRWIIAHLLNDKRFIFSYVLCTVLANVLNITIPVLVGRAYTLITQRQATAAQLLTIVLPLLGIALLGGVCDICGRLST